MSKAQREIAVVLREFINHIGPRLSSHQQVKEWLDRIDVALLEDDLENQRDEPCA